MAPPAKRRKRNIVEETDPDEDELPLVDKKNHNSLHKYLFSSPDAKQASTPAIDTVPVTSSPSPTLQAKRKAAAASQPASPSASGVLRSFNSRAARGTTKSPSTSPEKSRGKVQKLGKGVEKGRTADLVTLFSRQAERAVGNGTKKAETPAFEDIISDPISEEDDVGLHRAASSSFVGKNAQKRQKDVPSNESGTSAGAVRTGQMFLKPVRIQASVDEDQRPWSERFGPTSLEELAVHKKKVADVRAWLEEVIGGRRRQRLLILKGAAGTGKTTTVQLLAKEFQYEILEWRNPAGSLGATQGFASASAQFEEFMGRSGRFGQLELESDSPPVSVPSNSPAQPDRQKLVLIEEFPNTFMRSSSALTAFRSAVLQYLAANTPSLATFGHQPVREPVTPLVMIISETLLTTTSASADSFTAHRLLGPEILRHPGAFVIEFNAIAPTLMAKALEVIVQKESRKSGRRRTPGPLVLQRLGEIGDIRSAISSLEFLCLKGDDDAEWGAKVTFGKQKKGAKDGTALTRGEQDSLELISQRESTLGIFHAVGKVVYNKRDEAPFPSGSEEALAESLPAHLAEYSRPKRSQVSLDTLMDEMGTDTHTFVAALHENYVLSCERNGPADPHSSLDYITGCIEYLSESDLLCPSWDVFFGGRGFGASGSFRRDTGSHVVRQDELAFQVAVRGLLLSLPCPVKRQSAQGGRGGDTFKMFYPTSLKLWRAKEELEALIDLWAAKLLKGEATGLVPSMAAPAATPTAISPRLVKTGPPGFRKPRGSTSSVGDWPTKNPALIYTAAQLSKQQQQQQQQQSSQAPPTEKSKTAKDDAAAPIPLLALGSAARSEMVLERLPYMAHMMRGARRRNLAAGGPGAFGNAAWRDLDKVVSFQGIGSAGAEEDGQLDEDGDGAAADDGGGATNSLGAEGWSTDRPTEEGTSPRKKRGLGAILRRAARTQRGNTGRTGAAGTADGDGEDMLGATALSGPVMKLVLSDDDIEDED